MVSFGHLQHWPPFSRAVPSLCSPSLGPVTADHMHSRLYGLPLVWALALTCPVVITGLGKGIPRRTVPCGAGTHAIAGLETLKLGSPALTNQLRHTPSRPRCGPGACLPWGSVTTSPGSALQTLTLCMNLKPALQSSITSRVIQDTHTYLSWDRHPEMAFPCPSLFLPTHPCVLLELPLAHPRARRGESKARGLKLPMPQGTRKAWA